jgi:predicted dehydrogenase
MKPKYRIGVIGHTGRGDYGHGMDAVWHDVPGVEVVAVADADPAGLAAAAKRLQVAEGSAFGDYRKMLDTARPDIVSIGPRWLDQHRDMIVAAAQRGVHMLLEKPFCRTLAEADEIIDACERTHTRLVIAHQTRFSPKVEVIRRMIRDGKLGTVLELRGRGKEDARGGGEDLWVLGSHIMDLMRCFAGDAQSCYGLVTQNGRKVTRADVKDGNEGIGPLAGDAVHAMYTFSGGMTGYFSSVRNMGLGSKRFGVQIFGTKGVVEILTSYLPDAKFLPDPSWSPGRTSVAWKNISSAGLDQPEPLKDGALHAGNVAAVKDLLAAIENKRQPQSNIYDARAATEMIVAVFDSHRVGGPVALPLENRKNPLTMLPR